MKRLLLLLAALAPAVDGGPVYVDAARAVWRHGADGSLELCAPAAGADQAVCFQAPACGQEI